MTHSLRIVLFLALLAFGASLAGCVTNAATGSRQLNSLSREDEIAIGTQAAPELTQEYGGAVQDAALQAYIREVGMKMVPFVEGDYGTLPWEFTLLDSDIINAFALPGGKVFMSRGLAEKFTNEAELAGVLGHEIGHVTAEHADKRISNQMIAQGIIIGGSIALGASAGAEVAALGEQVLGGAGQGFLLKFSRDEESQADSLGMRYMTKAGYNPEGILGVMEVLKSASQGAGGQPEWLSTHPLPETRIQRVTALLNEPQYAEARRSLGPSGGTFEERYKSRFLDRVRALPKKPPSGQSSSGPQQNLAPPKRQ